MPADPIGQALLASQPVIPPPAGIACPHCHHWVVEPYFTLPAAAAILPLHEATLRRWLTRHRHQLPPPTYTKMGRQAVRLLTATDIAAIRKLRSAALPFRVLKARI